MTRLLMTISLLFLYTAVYSQSPIQVFSPNAANLGQYGQIPVNYFNGLPDISIPLTSFEAKGYDLPISLTYHASGNYPDSHPGWVGLGWSLKAGGMINRIIKGYKDERSEKEWQFLSNMGGSVVDAYYYNAEYRQSSNWNNVAYFSEISDRHAATFGHRQLDAEPDEFQVNIDDIQASFYIVGNNQVKIKSKTNANFKVSIKLDTSNSLYAVYKNRTEDRNLEANLYTYISELVITNSDGKKYYFGGDKNAIEFSFRQYPIYEPDYTIRENYWRAIGTANSWLLRKIELPNGETIEFTYEKSGTPVMMSDIHRGESYVISGSLPGSYVYDTKTEPRGRYSNVSVTFIQPSYLASIKSLVTGNEILFHRDKSKELEYIVPKNIFDVKVGDFSDYDYMNYGEFSYANLMLQSYYMQLDEIVEKNKKIRLQYSDNLQSRLKLLSVSFFDNKDRRIYKYGLTYNPLNLPPYNSKKTDHWGYYNDKYYGNTSYQNLVSYRTPDIYFMQAEMLTGIIYPTGGKSEFSYQAHSFSKVAEQFDFAIRPSVGIAGGLRIKEIKTTENGKTTTREFEYIDNLKKSSGILSGDPIYYISGKQYVDLHYRDWGQSMGINYKATYYLMQENHINQLSTTNGNHVTYSRIIEKLPDGSQIVYSYSNHDQYMDEIPVKMYDNFDNKTLTNSFTSKELERGLLLKTEYVNSAGFPVRTEMYKYNSSPQRYNDSVKSVNQMYLISNNLKRLSALKLYTFYPYLESKKTIIRDDSSRDSLTTVTNYEYNSDKLPSKISTINSKGEEEFESILYTRDLQNGVYTQMQNRNMLSFPVENIHVRNNNVIYSELSTYKMNNANSDYVSDKKYKAKLKFPLPYSQFVPFNGISKDSRYASLPEIEYTRYDRNSNIEEYVTKDGCATICIWGYSGAYPVAIFEYIATVPGASAASDIFYENFESLSSNFSFGYHSEKSHIGTYYVSMTTHSRKQYIVDYRVFKNGKWNYLKRDFIGDTTIGEVGCPLDEVRVYPKENVHITTYSYYPFTGLRSKTDEKGITESYEYDSFGRLMNVKNPNQELVKSIYYNYYNQ